MKRIKPKVGRMVRVQFDDIGSDDGVVVEVRDKDSFDYYSFHDRKVVGNNGAPIIELGPFIRPQWDGPDW